MFNKNLIIKKESNGNLLFNLNSIGKALSLSASQYKIQNVAFLHMAGSYNYPKLNSELEKGSRGEGYWAKPKEALPYLYYLMFTYGLLDLKNEIQEYLLGLGFQSELAYQRERLRFHSKSVNNQIDDTVNKGICEAACLKVFGITPNSFHSRYGSSPRDYMYSEDLIPRFTEYVESIIKGYTIYEYTFDLDKAISAIKADGVL